MNTDNEKDPYIMVYQFMHEEMGLKGGELMVYALIYGCCLSGNGMYNGSVSGMCRRTALKERAALNCLSSLVKKGYITKEVTPLHTPNIYRINRERVPGGRTKKYAKASRNNSDKYEFDVAKFLAKRENSRVSENVP